MERCTNASSRYQNEVSQTGSPVTLQEASNYHLAYADTLSVSSLSVLRVIAQNSRNPRLVSEIQNGLNDTCETGVQKISEPQNSVVPAIRKKGRSASPNHEQGSFSQPSRMEGNKLHVGNADPMPTPTPTPIDVGLFQLPATEMIDVQSAPACKPITAISEIRTIPENQTCSQMRSAVTEKDSTIPNHSSSNRLIISDRMNRINSRCQATPVNGTSPTANQLSSSKTSGETESLSRGCVVAGRYEIIQEIARGGFGIIYRARQLGLNRTVAIKCLHTRQEETTTQRFLLETEIIKDLIHPNTIQLIDAGIDREKLFYVMEYIDGLSLRALLNKEKSLSFQRTVNITRQILKSINEAHQRGIIHRDLKPSNILIRRIIGEADFVKVLDFGIAKTKNKSLQLTVQGKVMGTPQYLAPELLMGEEAAPASDLFAVGLIMLEMLTGSSPLPSDPVAIARVFTSTEYINIPSWIKNSALGPFIMKALSRYPGDRFQSAEEMLNELNSLENRTLKNYYHQMFSPIAPSRKTPNKTVRVLKTAAATLLVLFTNAVIIYHFMI